MMMDGSISRIAWIVRAKWFAPPSLRSSRATAVTTTCFKPIRRTASATRCGSSSSRANGFAVLTAQNPHARVQRSPAIIMVAVPWLQHSQRFGHCALSQTVCRRRSEMSALVEKKTGFEGRRTLIQGGFCAWCRAGSIFAQDMVEVGALSIKL
jgi:Tfp pilus assembly protein FimT